MSKVNDVYESVPMFENNQFLLRKVDKSKDISDLFEVYSDKKAVDLFNSDNCDGDTFYYDTKEKMEKAIDFWDDSYEKKWFVRWAIIDKESMKCIGTIELFHRDADDYFSNCGLLRLDLRSNYETKQNIESILKLIIKETYELFDCDKIATKAIEIADERRNALETLGFKLSDNKLVGFDGTEYDSYYVRLKSV